MKLLFLAMLSLIALSDEIFIENNKWFAVILAALVTVYLVYILVIIQ